MIIFLGGCLILLAGCVVFLAVHITRIAQKIFDLEESVEKSLDILDTSYRNLSRIAKYPVLYDDPIVQQAVREIARAKDSVLVVANKLMILDESLDNESKEERS